MQSLRGAPARPRASSRVPRIPPTSCRAQLRAPQAPVKNTVTYKVPSQPRLTFVGTAAAEAPGRAARTSWVKQRLGKVVPLPPITRSDADFGELGVEFLETVEGVRVAELTELFEKVGFPRRDPERLKVALQNTHRLVWVRATRHSPVARLGQLLGFARATSDGAFTATIWDVAVAPTWQRSGLGRGMMERLTRGLVQDGIPHITLYAEPAVIGMYRKLGFREDAVSRALAPSHPLPQPVASRPQQPQQQTPRAPALPPQPRLVVVAGRQ